MILSESYRKTEREKSSPPITRTWYHDIVINVSSKKYSKTFSMMTATIKKSRSRTNSDRKKTG